MLALSSAAFAMLRHNLNQTQAAFAMLRHQTMAAIFPSLRHLISEIACCSSLVRCPCGMQPKS